MTRKPIGLSVPYREFNEVEQRSKVKQTLISNPSKEAVLKAEVAALTEMVRALAARIEELEKR